MKYIIDIPKEYESDWVNKSSRLGFELCFPINETATNKKYHIPTGLKLESYTEPDRKAIEDEVWENTWKMFLTPEDLGATMGDSYSEAKAKYDAWKREKKEIHVGDEITYGDTNGVVVGIDTATEDSGVNVVCRDGNTGYIGMAYVTKTGRHFSEVDELLKKMRGEQE